MFGGRPARHRQVDRRAQGGRGLLVASVTGEQVHGAQHGAGRRVALQEMGDDRGERPRRIAAGGMAVGDPRASGGQLEGPRRVRAHQSERRRPHDGAAALGLRIDGSRECQRRAGLGGVPGGEAGQAGVAGGAARVQPGVLPERAGAYGVVAAPGRRGGVVLGVQPAPVRVADEGVLGARRAGCPGPGVGPDEALGREERHLGVVRDPSDDTVRVRRQSAYALVAVGAADAVQGEELHRVAEGVADGSAQQCPPYPGPPGDRVAPRRPPRYRAPVRCAVHSPLPLVRSRTGFRTPHRGFMMDGRRCRCVPEMNRPPPAAPCGCDSG
ncbi:hypothetical protein SAMN04883147_113287 [Streptomyces sp. DpondAA-F4]|nr:hypothetical protein SAMN04883147_113287 [Streptomyces sp. DpondAA-F4]